jgi:hypothetical protein
VIVTVRRQGRPTLLVKAVDGILGTHRAFSVAKFTVAVTPSSLFSFLSIRAAHEAQVIPPIDSPALPTGSAATSGLRIVPVINGTSLLPGPGDAVLRRPRRCGGRTGGPWRYPAASQ